MKNKIRISLVIALFIAAGVFALTRASSATQKTQWANLMAQLLDHPAPPPPMPKDVNDAIAEKDRLSKLEETNPDQEPAENASALEVIEFWRRQDHRGSNKQPTEKARWQLLEACLQRPEISNLCPVDYFPNTPAAYEKVKAYAEQLEPQRPPRFYTSQEAMDFHDQESSRKLFRHWLMRRGYYRDELIQSARAVSSKNQIYLENSDDLEALARLDWKTAKPIIESYLNNTEPLVQAFVLGLMYSHAMESGEESQASALRRQLLEQVSNQQGSSFARGHAYNALASYEWSGRDEWFLSLLATENLLQGKKSLLSDYMIAGPIKNAPDKWLSLFERAISNGDQTIRNNSAMILSELARRYSTPEALKLLLPWLSDPKWVTIGEEFEWGLVIEAAGNLRLPEAIPGLLASLSNQKEHARTKIVKALAKYSDPQIISQIIPALSSAIKAGQVDDYSLNEMIALLAKLGGLSEQEKLAGLEAYAAECQISIDDWREERTLRLSDPKTLSGQVGYALLNGNLTGSRWRAETPSLISESFAALVVERINLLRQEKPEVAAKLWIIAREWNFPAIDLVMAERIVSADVDFEEMLKALRCHQRLAANAGSVLQPMLRQLGHARGIATILLNDEDEINSILNGKDGEAQMALLACARVIREVLPIESVGKLLKTTNKQLALAVERYLESEDGAAARDLLWAAHANEALILGGQPDFNPKRKYAERETNWENSLRDEVKLGLVEEVFAAYEVQTFDTAPFRQDFIVEVRARGDEATVCRRKDSARQECRSMLFEELSALRSLFEEVSFDDLMPLPIPGGGLGGTSFEFVRIGKQGGRRVLAANLYSLHSDFGLGVKRITPHDKLNSFFAKLKNTGEYELRYALKEKIKELEVLSADDSHPVTAICAQASEIRALVKNKENDALKWRTIKGGKLAEESEQPAICPIIDAQEDLPESKRSKFGYMPPIWPISAKGFVLRNMDWNDVDGLWLCQAGKEPKLIYRGNISPILVTLDGRWLIASKYEDKTGAVLQRIDLKTNAISKIEIENWVYPISREPLSGKVIIPTSLYDSKTEKDTEGNKLYDPATGKLESISGELEPLKHQDERPLQPIAGSATEFWAAIPDRKAKKTRVGRYDARSFKFTLLMELPEIAFNSTSMWVDESSGWLYIAYNGHLLRLPFSPKSSGQQSR